jgi:hypothetical protein
VATTVTAHNYTKYILSIASNLSDQIQTFELPYNEYTFSTTTSAYKYAEINDFVVEFLHLVDEQSQIKDIVKAIELMAPEEVKKIYIEVERDDGSIIPLLEGYKSIIFRIFRIETRVFNAQMEPTLVETIRMDVSSK